MTASGKSRVGLIRRRSAAVRTLVGLALLSVIGASCSASSNDDEVSNDSTKEPVEGGSLTIGVSSEPGGFDPFVQNFLNYPYIQTFYDTLVRDDADATPALAESWSMSDDHLSATVVLRQDVKFHSGRLMTSDDVVKTFERAADPVSGQAVLGNMSGVSSTSALDEFTVKIDLKSKTPELAVEDILRSIPILDSAALEDINNSPAGTGPFKFVEWRPGVSVKAEKNPDYWDTSGPYVDDLEFKIFGDGEALIAAFRSGDLDIVFDVPVQSLSLLDPENVVQGAPGSSISSMWLNTAKPPFDNELVRQAMRFAINREGIVDAVYLGHSEPRALPWPPTSLAYDADAVDDNEFDLEKAAELLQESGVEDLSGEILLAAGFSDLSRAAEILQSDLKTIGFDLKVVTLETAVWIERVLAGEFNAMATFSSAVGYPSTLISTYGARLDGNPLFGGGAPPDDFVAAIEAASAALTEEEQTRAFEALNAAINRGSWTIDYADRPGLFGVQDGVEGFTTNRDSMPLFASVFLSS